MLYRLFGWGMLALLVGFLIENFLIYHYNATGVVTALRATNFDSAWISLGFYLITLISAIGFTLSHSRKDLRIDAAQITNINHFVIRAAFWMVFLVGLVDAAISWLRVEDMLDDIIGKELAGSLARSNFRGPYLHLPFMVIGFVIACFSRSLGFMWLTLLVVAAQLLIVLGRFIFSYEHAFVSDLVRFWYAALFLFASAYTLLEDGHVRVDIFYAGLKKRWKGLIDAVGAVVLGMVLCWTILIFGTNTQSGILIGPLLVYETTQAGFGMYVKYLMAGFLGIFAITMMLQFIAAFFSGIADWHANSDDVEHHILEKQNVNDLTS